jgi:hypothetical protein
VPLSLYLHLITEEKREKRKPHILARFSPISVSNNTSCVNLCGWCVLLLSLSFSHFNYFITLSIKIMIINLSSKENKPA